MATLQEQYAARQKQSQDNINQTYDSTLNSQKQSLRTAYDQSMAAQNQAAEELRNQYAGANRQLASQAAQTQRSMDRYADVRNLNRQAGSQQALSLNLARQRAAGQLAAQQNMAMAEMERQKELMRTAYNNQVQQAIADNDYRRAAALLDDYNNQNTWLEKNAGILAGYGDFSGYGQLYGDSAASGMRNMWIAQNPDLAYRTGAIDANRYHAMTGQWPAGYTPPNAGGGYTYYAPAQQKEPDKKPKLPAEVGGQSTRARMTGMTQ